MSLCLLLAIVSYGLATLPGLKVVGALTLALAAGILWRSTLGVSPSLMVGIRVSARTVLRLGIVLMGARLDFAKVAQAGPKVLLLDLVVILVGMLSIPFFSRQLEVPRTLGILLAVGSSICGASAVVAAGPVVGAPEDETSLAVGLCGILGMIGVLIYLGAGTLLGLSPVQLGVLTGSTLHEVAQVMAASFSFGAATGDVATLVKLIRVVMLAPTLLVLSLVAGRGARMKFSWQEPPIPWFVLGFLAVGVLGSVSGLPREVIGGVSQVSIFLMTMAMVAMGLNLPLTVLRSAGMKVIYAGLLGFAALVLVSYSLIQLLGIV